MKNEEDVLSVHPLLCVSAFYRSLIRFRLSADMKGNLYWIYAVILFYFLSKSKFISGSIQ